MPVCVYQSRHYGHTDGVQRITRPAIGTRHYCCDPSVGYRDRSAVNRLTRAIDDSGICDYQFLCYACAATNEASYRNKDSCHSVTIFCNGYDQIGSISASEAIPLDQPEQIYSGHTRANRTTLIVLSC